MVGLWVFLKLEWNPLHPRTPPAKSAGLFDFISPFLSLLSIFPCFLVFGSAVATASSSASATTSSFAFATVSFLVSTYYLIQTNYVTISI